MGKKIEKVLGEVVTDNTELLSKTTYPKSNYLISAKYKSNILENKLLALSMSRSKYFEDDGKGHLIDRISAKDLKNALGINSNRLYSELKATAKIMTTRSLGYTDPNTHVFEYHTLITDVYYDNATLTVFYNANLKDWLVKFDKSHKYTNLNLKVMLSFTSQYTFRLYELIKSKCFSRNLKAGETNVYIFKYNVAELMFEIGILDTKASDTVVSILNKSENPDYDKARELALKATAKPPTAAKVYSEFKRTVLDRAVKEIHNNKDINMHIDYELIRKGKGGKATDLIFNVTLGNTSILFDPNVINELTADEKEDFLDDIRDIIEEKIKIKDLRAIAEAANYNLAVIEEKYNLSKSQNIDNLVGWLISAIKEDYQKPVSTIKSNYNFEESDTVYDEELLLDN